MEISVPILIHQNSEARHQTSFNRPVLPPTRLFLQVLLLVYRAFNGVGPNYIFHSLLHHLPLRTSCPFSYERCHTNKVYIWF